MIPSLQKAATADEKAAVAKSLAAVRKALGERNKVKAAEQLNLATLEASSPDSLAAIDRMKTLESALDAFWKAVDQGIKGLKTVDELNYDGMTGVVINAEPGSLSLRIEGQSKEYKVDKLPTGLAYHLAERWLRRRRSSDQTDSRLLPVRRAEGGPSEGASAMGRGRQPGRGRGQIAGATRHGPGRGSE